MIDNEDLTFRYRSCQASGKDGRRSKTTLQGLIIYQWDTVQLYGLHALLGHILRFPIDCHCFCPPLGSGQNPLLIVNTKVSGSVGVMQSLSSGQSPQNPSMLYLFRNEWELGFNKSNNNITNNNNRWKHTVELGTLHKFVWLSKKFTLILRFCCWYCNVQPGGQFKTCTGTSYEKLKNGNTENITCNKTNEIVHPSPPLYYTRCGESWILLSCAREKLKVELAPAKTFPFGSPDVLLLSKSNIFFK